MAVLQDCTILDTDGATRFIGNLWIVGHHDEGLIKFCSATGQQVQNLVTGFLVQISRGLISDDQLRLGQD